MRTIGCILYMAAAIEMACGVFGWVWYITLIAGAVLNIVGTAWKHRNEVEVCE